MLQKNLSKIWDVNVNNIVISKLVKRKTSSKYFIGIKFDKVIRRLVFLMSKLRGYVKHLTLKKKINIKAIN